MNSSAPPDRFDVLGVRVSALTIETAVDAIAGFVARREPTYVCVTGAHGVIESQDDPELMAIHNKSGLTTPDGMPLVLAGRWAGATISRVYGPDLVEALAPRVAREGWRVFLYGGAEGVADDFGDALRAMAPGLVVAGTYCPPFRPLTSHERSEVADVINQSRADIVLVGLSTPKQERWMAEMRPDLEPAVLIGVGAAFDFHTGRVRQAPNWMQRMSLEWLFRLLVEPRRLWRRYVKVVPRFLVGIVRRPPSMCDAV